MAALDTVQDYVTAARVLLQDQSAPYRYPDLDLVAALSFAMLEARKLRPDLFLTTTPQNFTANDATAVSIDMQYRMPILYYLCGFAQLRDDENTQDARAAGLLGKFTAGMTGLG
jgi:hypothetical protein